MPFPKYMYDLGRELGKANPTMMRLARPALSDESLRNAIEGVDKTLHLSHFMIDCEGKLELPTRLRQGPPREQLENYARAYIALLEQFKALLYVELEKPLDVRSFDSLDMQYQELKELAVQAHQHI